MYKDDRGLYRKQVTINGKRKVFSGKTQREVMLKIAEYEETAETVGVPFSSVAAEWWADCEKNLQPNTLKGYSAAHDKAVDWFGDKNCADITAQEITAYLQSYSHMAQKTITNLLLIVRLILQYACVHHGLTFNAAAMVKPPKGKGKHEREFPDEDDIQIVNASVDEPFGLFMYATLWSGLRRGEMAGLRWEDIDFTAKTIHVRRAVYWTNDHIPQIKSPKTASGKRDVPLMDALAEKLLPLKGKPKEYVFGGAEPLHSYQIDKAMAAYRKATGLKCTLHGLRHGFASILFGVGLDIKTVALILGHAQTSTTMDIYVHLMAKDKLKDAREKLNNLHNFL